MSNQVSGNSSLNRLQSQALRRETRGRLQWLGQETGHNLGLGIGH